MELGLKGKRALVTGASSGLGLAAAKTLLQEGADVTIVSRNEERLNAGAEKINSAIGIKPSIITGDVSSKSDVDWFVKSSGPFDIVVSNTGGPPPGKATEIGPEQWREMADLVLFSAINLTRAVLDGMIERKFGRIIYITSIGMLQPIDDLIFSNTFRAGIAGYSKTISNNYARHGITANCVCPGYTATERLQELADARAKESGQTPEEVRAGFATDIPAGRLGDPEELAALIAFLASDKAAYITGASIPVDGGYVRSLI